MIGGPGRSPTSAGIPGSRGYDALGGGISMGGGAGGFHPGMNPNMGPGAQQERERIQRAIDAARGSWWDRALLQGLSMALPGASVARQPNYISGVPDLVTSVNPFGMAGSFLSGFGFNPFGDMMAPDWADIEVGRMPIDAPGYMGERTGRRPRPGSGIMFSADPWVWWSGERET